MSLFQRLNSAAPQQEVSNYFRNRNNKLKPAPPVPAPSEFVDDTQPDLTLTLASSLSKSDDGAWHKRRGAS
jgi:hypothetical protein